MHLPHGDQTVRFGAVTEYPVEKSLQSNGNLTSNQVDSHIDNAAKSNGHESKSNEVDIQIPQNRDVENVLTTILTAWTILIQRYQRDVFHQFTWGIKDAGDVYIQCIPTSELDLLKQEDTKSLNAKIDSVKSKDISPKQDTGIFLNDGTKAEVCIQINKFPQHD